MNKSIIRYILGWVLVVEGAVMMLPCLCATVYLERQGFYFLMVGCICMLAGFFITRFKPGDTRFYVREGCMATALSWIMISIVGALPFYLSGEIPSFLDALFETVSGFTTTGSSILTDVESMAKCMLFWRSFTHWLGGMGVLVFLLAIIRMTGGSNMNLMRAESTGPSVGKLVPKIRHSARITYLIYIGMSVVMLIFLLAGRMPLFDALLTTFGTAGTGGFGICADSMAGYSPYIQWVTTIFMLLFGVNFTAYYLLLLKKWSQAFGMEEIRAYFLIVVGFCALILVNAYDTALSFAHNLRDVAFTVASVITTTGFATVDFNLWPQTSRILLVILMFIGGCAGSTAGGMKVCRIVLLVKSLFRELSSYLHPKRVKKIQMDRRPVEEQIIHSVNIYAVAVFLLFMISIFLVSFDDLDLVTEFTAVATTLNNVGPGLNLVGPTGNFSMFSNLSKLVMIFDMLAGRLELFPMLMLLYPPTWKSFIKR